MNELVERVERLERSAQRWRWAAGVLGGLLIAGISIGAKTDADAVRAQSFTLVDRGGRPMAYLGATEEGPALTFYDSKDRPRLTLAVTNEGGSLRIRNDKGLARLELAQKQGDVGLFGRDQRGKVRVAVQVPGDRNRPPSVSVRDENEQPKKELK